ncbi:MAG: hypothetical protein HZA17_01055 [Nitrospirae bacterium]|nr:hypothetical protein [Nitrospirota bacterium]
MERNIGMTFDFIRQMVDKPEILDTITNGAELDFIDKDLPFKTKGQGKKKIARYKVEHVFEPIKS